MARFIDMVIDCSLRLIEWWLENDIDLTAFGGDLGTQTRLTKELIALSFKSYDSTIGLGKTQHLSALYDDRFLDRTSGERHSKAIIVDSVTRNSLCVKVFKLELAL